MSVLTSTGAEAVLDAAPDRDHRWFVLQTKSRQEKIRAKDLQARGINYYLPLVRAIRTYGGRSAEVELPLFPGYLFLRGTLDDAYLSDRTRRVAGILPVHDQERMGWELRNIALAVEGGVQLDAYPYLQDGVRVEVRSGPFRGIQGLIDGRGKHGLLILQVNLLGRAVSMEVDPSLLDVIE
jgi:transcription antitermination factor NusG